MALTFRSRLGLCVLHVPFKQTSISNYVQRILFAFGMPCINGPEQPPEGFGGEISSNRDAGGELLYCKKEE